MRIRSSLERISGFGGVTFSARTKAPSLVIARPVRSIASSASSSPAFLLAYRRLLDAQASHIASSAATSAGLQISLSLPGARLDHSPDGLARAGDVTPVAEEVV